MDKAAESYDLQAIAAEMVEKILTFAEHLSGRKLELKRIINPKTGETKDGQARMVEWTLQILQGIEADVLRRGAGRKVG